MKKQIFAGAEHARHAVFLIAGQEQNHKFVLKSPLRVRNGQIPDWIGSPADLDFLDANNPFFVADRALYSIGQHLGGMIPPGMFLKRPGVTMLADSGGFQLIERPQLWEGNTTRAWVLNAQEDHFDEAITLDVPTAAIGPNSVWRDFDAALDCTVDNLTYIAKNARGSVRYLNALQGRDEAEFDRWYMAVRGFPFGGWAVGGKMRSNWPFLVNALVGMARCGELGPEQNRVHVLGAGDLRSAVALSALQRGLRRLLGDDRFLITFDASSASTAAGLSRKVYGFPKLETLSMTSFRPPFSLDPTRADLMFPIPSSAVAAHMRLGDYNVPKPGSIAQTSWDGLSEALLVHHNAQATLSAIQMANRAMDLDPADATQILPADVVTACHRIEEACGQANPLTYLRHASAKISALR